MKKGHVVSVMGPVVDLEFERGSLPEILNAVKIEQKGEAGGIDINLTLEVAVHLGDNKVRAVAMSTT
ncbi:F0F1 ATP synthase subunit beta, partial [Paenibacillus sp. MCAF20]